MFMKGIDSECFNIYFLVRFEYLFFFLNQVCFFIKGVIWNDFVKEKGNFKLMFKNNLKLIIDKWICYLCGKKLNYEYY